MDAYTERLERTLTLALEEISRLRSDKIRMRAEAKRQWEFTLDAVTRDIGRMTALEQRGDQLQVLVGEIIQNARR